MKFSAGRLPRVIEIRSHVDDGMHGMTVRGNGTGFGMKYHDRIFQILQRLHRTEDHEGAGVGLTIAHKAMTRMGGRIWAESEPGTGAAFHVELPRDACAIDAKPGFAARWA